MKIEDLDMVPIAVGLHSLGIYYGISLIWPGGFGWLLFWTGFVKHISVEVLGLDDYFCHFQFKRTSRNLTETEIGRNPGGKEFREKWGLLVLGAIIEGCVFGAMGCGIYLVARRLKKGWNVFIVGVLVHILTGVVGLCHCGLVF